jgi:hypothetical protein
MGPTHAAQQVWFFPKSLPSAFGQPRHGDGGAGTSQHNEISRHDLKCHTSHHNPHTQACPVAIRRADARAVRHILSARRPTDGARAPIFALQIQATGHDTTRHDTVTRVCLSQTSHSTHTKTNPCCTA